MADQRYTIIVVPHTRSSLRKCQISTRVLSYALIALCALFLVGIGVLAHYVKLYRDARNYVLLEKQNQELRASLEQSQLLTQKLNRKLSFLTDLSNKLKVMAGLPLEVAGKKRMLQQPGLGGVTMYTTSSGIPDSGRLLQIEKRAQYLEQSFDVLNEYFHHQNTALSFTPSILPSAGFLTSSFGARRNPFTNAPDFHEGIDITNEVGTPIVSPADGKVVFIGQKGSYGNVVEILHRGEIKTLFGHMDQVRVKVGQEVKRWDVIGTVGNTGKSTGPHLHYEVHVGENPVNPLPYILNLDTLG
jgi:murein DD-endopeptidase MepM/ murein hydrolase activator NlpD